MKNKKQKQKTKKSGFMTMKLDMNKTYDQVEWSILCQVMEKWVLMISGSK